MRSLFSVDPGTGCLRPTSPQGRNRQKHGCTTTQPRANHEIRFRYIAESTFAPVPPRRELPLSAKSPSFTLITTSLTLHGRVLNSNSCCCRFRQAAVSPSFSWIEFASTKDLSFVSWTTNEPRFHDTTNNASLIIIIIAFKIDDRDPHDRFVVSLEITKIVPLTCHGHSRPITHVSFSSLLPSSGSPSQFYLISACKDNNPMLRDGLTGDWIGTFIGHKGAVWSARLSDDATLAATGSADFSAKVWDTFTGETLHTLQHNHIVRAVAFPPLEQPSMLATGGMEKKLRIFDLARSPGADGTTSVGNSTTGADAIPVSYELGAGEHQGAIKSVIWTRNINTLITASDDKMIRWWDLRSRACIASHGLDALPGSCELNGGLGDQHSTGSTVSVAAGKNIYFFDGARPGTLLKHIATDREVASVALNGAAKRFVTGSPNDTWVHVWDFDTGRELETGRGHHGPVWTTCFSPDGKLYATGSEDGTVKLWKFTEGAYGLWR
ncbi:hypothetical protein MRB53_040490 [Persea americana]|nr:hypothetical protein MRB53_040490 [Persea americana]